MRGNRVDEPREVELKLDLPRSAADALARKGAKALGAAGTGKRERLTSVYFDTPERNLHKRGLTLYRDEVRRGLRYFSTQEMLDLQVWFNLAWCGYTAVRLFPGRVAAEIVREINLLRSQNS